MARVTLSGIITDINGSIGGWTFQNGVSGKIVRVKPIQSKAITVKKGSNLQIPSGLRNAWGLITGTTRTDWNNYAAANAFTDIYGNVKALSGYQFFFSSIMRQYYMGTLVTLNPPLIVPPPDVMDDFTITADATHLNMAFVAPFLHTNNKVWIFCTSPVHMTTQSNRMPYRLISIQTPNNSTTTDITTPFQNYFSLNWNTLFTSGSFNIWIRAFLCRNTSGITSLAKFATLSI